MSCDPLPIVDDFILVIKIGEIEINGNVNEEDQHEDELNVRCGVVKGCKTSAAEGNT
jgi:hypothetical protein